MTITAPPWVVFDDKNGTYDILPAGRKGWICGTTSGENAEFIVRAVNCHAELVEALKACWSGIDRLGAFADEDHFRALEKGKAALAKVLGADPTKQQCLCPCHYSGEYILHAHLCCGSLTDEFRPPTQEELEEWKSL